MSATSDPSSAKADPLPFYQWGTWPQLQDTIVHAPTSSWRVLACSMVRNEALYISEWLAFHMATGVDHFIIFDHESEDNLTTILQPWILLGWVTLVPWPTKTNQAQPLAMKACTQDYQSETDWLIFFDTDEFLRRNDSATREGRPAKLGDWLDANFDEKQVGGVALPRFGSNSNGYEHRPPSNLTVLEAYTDRHDMDSSFYVPKMIFRPAYVQLSSVAIHHQEYEQGRKLIDSSGAPYSPEPNSTYLKAKGGFELLLHHYWSKSFDECMTRVVQPAYPGSWREQMGRRFCAMQLNGTKEFTEPHEQDDYMVRFGPAVKRIMGNVDKLAANGYEGVELGEEEELDPGGQSSGWTDKLRALLSNYAAW